MASWARLSLDALTIFMALVICMVEPTETIRLRTSFKFAILLDILLCHVLGNAGENAGKGIVIFSGLQIVQYIFVFAFQELQVIRFEFLDLVQGKDRKSVV